MQLNPEPRGYYTSQGPMSDPGSFAHLYQDLPGEVASLCEVVQGNLLHIFWAERYGRKLSEAEQQTVGYRSMRQKLDLIQKTEPKPLIHERSLAQKQVGNCRDFTLMLVSLLRSQRIPARARCGFGAYFLPGHYEDHWVAEYWNTERAAWVLVDSQLDAFQIQVLKPDFDPLDVPRNRFIIAGDAWQMCRLGRADPQNFGIFDMHGWWFIWGNVARDFLALNKVEILPWDHELGVFTHRLNDPLPDPGPELAFYDQIASITLAGDLAFPQVRTLYEQDDRWRFPLSWLDA